MLGTTYHETAHTMRPVKEYGGAAYHTRMYDIEGERPDKARELGNLAPGDGALYCGRGYVQLTGKANYARMSRMLGVDLVAQPDMAMEQDIAARIMFAGMTAEDRKDTFTGVNLQRFFNDTTEDWVNARKIINGLDHAVMIAGTARRFYTGLAVVESVDVAELPAVELPPPSAEPPPPSPPPSKDDVDLRKDVQRALDILIPEIVKTLRAVLKASGQHQGVTTKPRRRQAGARKEQERT